MYYTHGILQRLKPVVVQSLRECHLKFRALSTLKKNAINDLYLVPPVTRTDKEITH